MSRFTGMDVDLSAELEIRLARMLEAAGDPGAAARAWSRAANRDLEGPWAAEAVLGLAALMLSIGQAQQGRALMERIVVRYPGTGAAAKAELVLGKES